MSRLSSDRFELAVDQPKHLGSQTSRISVTVVSFSVMPLRLATCEKIDILGEKGVRS